jgi:glutaredoxin
VATVVLYARPGCHLCDDARAVIEAARAEVAFVFEEVDIETDDALVRDYGLRIPVVAIDGDEVFEIAVDRTSLLAAVAAEGDRGSIG